MILNMKLIFVFSFLLAASNSYGIKCAYISHEKQVEKSKYVFLGKVTEIEGEEVYMDIIENFGEPIGKEVKLEFKGMGVFAGDPGSSRYEIGTDYLIGTGGEKKVDGNKPVFSIFFCSLQEKAEDVAELLKSLREKKKNK